MRASPSVRPVELRSSLFGTSFAASYKSCEGLESCARRVSYVYAKSRLWTHHGGECSLLVRSDVGAARWAQWARLLRARGE